MVFRPGLLLDYILKFRVDLGNFSHGIDERMFIVIDEILFGLKTFDVGI